MSESRLSYNKPIIYSKGILLGNWVEDSAVYKTEYFNNTSTYHDDFNRKPLTTNTPENMWDAQLKMEGAGGIYPHRAVDVYNFYDNYSTTYDLAYNHFPKWQQNVAAKQNLSYLNSYGNITKSGWTDYLKLAWNQDKLDPRRTTESAYTESFRAPPNYDTGRDCKCVPECNPITWECKSVIRK